MALKFSYQGQLLGILKAGKLVFPEFRAGYLDMVTHIAQVCALAVADARMYQEMQALATTDSLTGLNSRRTFF